MKRFGFMQSGGPPIALDFGATGIKALQIAPGDRPSLIAAAHMETPEELRSDPQQRLEHQLAAVGNLLKSAPFKGRRVICSIPAPHAFVQHLQVQRAEGADMTQLVTAQLQAQTGAMTGGLVVRHTEVADVQRGTSTRTEVICIAIRRALVFRMLEALKAAKAECVGIHSEHMALPRAFGMINRREGDDERPTLILDMGAGSTKVIIAHGADPVFAKTIEVCGQTLDAALAERLGCGLAEARTRRLRANMLGPSPTTPGRPGGGAAAPGPGAGEATSDGGAQPEREAGTVALAEDRRDGEREPGVIGAGADGGPAPGGVDLSEALEGLTDEAAMCMRYHRALFPGRGVERVVFVGGEARSLALCQHVARSLRLPALVADPASHLEGIGKKACVNVDFSQPQPGWALPFGLAHSPADL